MANIFLQQKAENTLKRADDLIETGQKRVAFQELQSIIAGTRSTKNRQWSETVEEVMMKFIELCVDLRKGSEAKTAIMQFKSLCLPDHASSLDKALKYFVEQAEQRALTAQTQSNSESLTLQKDLEDEIPENILMSEVSGEDLKDRKDREIVTPWLKFLWETYRIVLDILKMFPNKELQIRYHDTSQRAFKFCKDYKRKQEFRRLAEMLRIHLANIQKYASQKDATHAKINLNNAETIQNYLDTRFKQLDVASDLELWNEAFKSIEDIHALIRLSKKAVDPLLMIKFYEHLTKIFWVSENYLLHAYAYYKLFNLRIALKKEDNNLEHLSSTLFLAALSIPSTSTEYDIMNIDFVEREKQQRMAFLLGLTVPPTKEQLLEEIIKKQVSKHVASELSSLYHILEVDFHPLDLCSKMSAVFKFLETKPELSNYIRPLQKITLSRLLPQLSKVYEVIKISEIVKLAPFVSLPEIEREIVLSVQQRHLQATIDHQSSSIIFGKGVAPFDSDNLRSELIKLSKKLAEARLLISPQQIQSERESQEKLVKSIVSKLPEEHAQLLERKQFIEKKKIYLANEKKKEEELREVKAREAAKKREEEEKKEQERQQQKLEEEAKKRREEEEKISQAQLLLAELEKNNAITDQTLKALAAKAGKKKKAAAADIAAVVDVDTLLEVKREEIEKEKKEREKKLTDEAKNFDYLERARRLEEIPLLKEHYLKQKKEDREAYEKLVQKSEEDFKKQLTETQQMRSQIEKMFEDKNEFVADFVMKKRKELYEKKLEDYNKKKDDAKQKWLARREKIKQEIDRIDEEKLQKQREREEKERKQQEEENKRRKEQEDREEKLRRISEMQLQKEREAEERIRKQKEEALKRLPPKDDKKAYRPPTSSRWENIDSDKDKQPAFTKRRFDDDEPPRRRFEDDQGPPRRRFEDDQPPRRRFEDDSSAWRSPAAKKDDQGPPRRRFEDDQPPRRRFEDDQGPPRRRFEDDQGPPRRRFEDDQPPRRRFEDDQPKRRQEDDQTWQRSAKKPASSSSTSSAFSSTPAPKTQTTADDDGWQKASSKTSGGRWR